MKKIAKVRRGKVLRNSNRQSNIPIEVSLKSVLEQNDRAVRLLEQHRQSFLLDLIDFLKSKLRM